LFEYKNAEKKLGFNNDEIGLIIIKSLRNTYVNNYVDALRVIYPTAKSIINSGKATVNTPIK